MIFQPVNVDLDLDINLTNSTMYAVHVNQKENNVREIHCHIKNDGEDFKIPDGTTIRIQIVKPNGNEIYSELSDFGGSLSSDRTTISFPIKNNITSISGRHIVCFELIFSNNSVENTERSYSNNFYINVHKGTIDDEKLKDSSEYKVLEEMNILSRQYMEKSAEYSNKSLGYANTSKSYMEKANTYANNAKVSETNSLTNSQNAISSASDARSYAKNASDSATQAKSSETNAKSYETNAKNYTANALSYKNDASNYARTARSYAVGDTGYRGGEETDNAKYYSQQAKIVSDSVPSYISQIETAANNQISRVEDTLDKATAKFTIDLSTGHLMYTGCDAFNFNINRTNGHLEWELI